MDVVAVMVDLFEIERWVVLRDLEQLPAHVREETVVEYLPAVFGRKDEVVVTEPDAMAAFAIFSAHEESVRRFGRGNEGCGYAPPSPG